MIYTKVQTAVLVYIVVQFAGSSGFIIDNEDILHSSRDISPRSRTAFLQSFIRRLRSDDLERMDDLNSLVPRDYYTGSSGKRDYGINPPFHELCRMLNIPYCAYRS
ncbi:uncharacterized protein LOC125660950 [Ostrea edulis]|uniref:uncharacterized protein LOC125660950 n=1 Tax=Ostrea edulis TaxID=37623 RepID=UPI002095A18C|nr:uncharacterized protein LOC125660950 [Ostrea edulis]